MPTVTERPVFAELTSIFREVLGDPNLELSRQTTADDVPGWDSMTHITLIVEAECRFGVQFQTAEIETLHCLDDLLRAIESKRMRAIA